VNADGRTALAGLATEERLRVGDLIAELNSRAGKIGLNTTDWPGLTMYRFEAPVVPQWNEVHALSLCVVAQGRKAVTIDGSTYCYDPFNYLVLSRGMRFEAEILKATVEKPFLSFVLQIDPAIVRRVSADLREHTTTTFRRPASRSTLGGRAVPARVTPLDANTAGAVLRFLRAATVGPDRRVLAPMYLSEIVYRVLQAEQWRLLLDAATLEHQNDPVPGPSAISAGICPPSWRSLIWPTLCASARRRSPTCSATSPACRRTSSSRASGWSARGSCSWKAR